MKKFIGILVFVSGLSACGDNDPFAPSPKKPEIPQDPNAVPPDPVLSPFESANQAEFNKALEQIDFAETVLSKTDYKPEDMARDLAAIVKNLKEINIILPDGAIEGLFELKAVNRPNVNENLVTKTEDSKALVLLDYQLWYTGYLSSNVLRIDFERISGKSSHEVLSKEKLDEGLRLEYCQDTFEHCTATAANFKGKLGLGLRGIRSFKIEMPGSSEGAASYLKLRYGYLSMDRFERLKAYMDVLAEIRTLLEKAPALISIAELKFLRKNFTERFAALDDWPSSGPRAAGQGKIKGFRDLSH